MALSEGAYTIWPSKWWIPTTDRLTNPRRCKPAGRLDDLSDRLYSASAMSTKTSVNTAKGLAFLTLLWLSVGLTAWHVLSSEYKCVGMLTVRTRGRDVGLVMLRDHPSRFAKRGAVSHKVKAELIFFNQSCIKPCFETVSADLLQLVPGIGPKLAAAIVRVRGGDQELSWPSALSLVEGIGPERARAIEESFSFEPCPAPPTPKRIEL